MDWAGYKAQARKTVHQTFRVEVDYSDVTLAAPKRLHARYHNRLDRGGIGAPDGYAAVLEGINRIVFERAELQAAGIELRDKGRVDFLAYGISFRLDILDPKDGVDFETWTVVPV